MDILAIAGSLREDSYNCQLAHAAQAVMEQRHPDVGVSLLDWGDVPLFNQDSEYPTPYSVARVRDMLRAADGVWLFCPEYNHAIPGPLKNLLDWLSRPISAGEGQVFANKPTALAGTSIGVSGAAHAQEQLINILSLLDVHIMNQPRLSIPYVGMQAEEGVLMLTTSLPYLERQSDAFVTFIERAGK